MVQRNPALVSNAATSVPTATSGTAVVFTARAVAGDFANSTTGNGVCNVCHTRKDTTPNKMVHWYNQAPYTNDNHNSGTVCTQCHKHSADTVYNGDAYKGGGCNGCHDYDTRVGFNWGDGFTGQAVEGFGAHKKHIDHIKARFAPLTLDPNLDQFGLGAAAQVCGTCHTNTVGNHTTDGIHKRHPEIPVVTRESRRTSRKTTWFPSHRKMKPFPATASQEKSHVRNWRSKRYLAPLMRPHKVPRHPGLPGEEHRGFPAPLPLSPFYPPDLDRRVDSPALSGRGSRPSGRTSG